MALNYVVVKRVFGFDETKTAHFVAKPVLGDAVEFEELCEKVNQMSGIHRGMVKVIMESMIDAMINDVLHGHPVRLGAFGSVRPTIRSKASKTAAEAGMKNIYRLRLLFTPGTAFADMLGGMSINKFELPDTGGEPEPIPTPEPGPVEPDGPIEP